MRLFNQNINMKREISKSEIERRKMHLTRPPRLEGKVKNAQSATVRKQKKDKKSEE